MHTAHVPATLMRETSERTSALRIPHLVARTAAQGLEAAETSSVAASVCAGGATGEGVGRMDSGPVAGPVGAV